MPERVMLQQIPESENAKLLAQQIPAQGANTF
jgi:hypothetical protein